MASFFPLALRVTLASSERDVSRFPQACARRLRDFSQMHWKKHFVVNLIRSKRTCCVGSRVDKISAEVVTRQELSRSMSRVISDKLEQPPRLNNGVT